MLSIILRANPFDRIANVHIYEIEKKNTPWSNV